MLNPVYSCLKIHVVTSNIYGDLYISFVHVFSHNFCRTVQFYLRLGCSKSPPDPATPPVYLQYTTNGGVNWHTVEQFDFNLHSNKPEYIVLHLPERSRSPATQLKWWQPSKDGTFMEPWAIDQVLKYCSPLYLSCNIRKPTLYICAKNKGTDQHCSNYIADQRLSF